MTLESRDNNESPTAWLTVANGQLAVSGETGKYPEFAGNVLTMDIRKYWRGVEVSPSTQGYHYNQNAETYVLVGDAIVRGMLKLHNEKKKFYKTLGNSLCFRSDTG